MCRLWSLLEYNPNKRNNLDYKKSNKNELTIKKRHLSLKWYASHNLDNKITKIVFLKKKIV